MACRDGEQRSAGEIAFLIIKSTAALSSNMGFVVCRGGVCHLILIVKLVVFFTFKLDHNFVSVCEIFMHVILAAGVAGNLIV